MQFGLLSHDDRYTTSPADAWDADLREVILAERLGFAEAWITEHFGAPRPGLQQCPDLFICKAAALTKRIKLGPGVRSLPLHHPVHVATEAAVCDQLTRGRYLAGFGAGGEMGNTARRLGLGDVSERHERMYEAIDFILRCWAETEPFDWNGRFWQCKDVKINPRPYQQPRMPTAMAASRIGPTLPFAAERGLALLIGHYDPPAFLKQMVDIYIEAGEKVGRRPLRKDIRVARFVYVSDSVQKARAELRDTLGEILGRRKQGLPYQFQAIVPPGGTLDDVTFDYMVDIGAIWLGDPDTVYEHVKNAYDEIGGFGTLMFYCGMDAGTRRQRARSLRLFSQYVAPRLVDLNPDRTPQPTVTSGR